MASLRSRLLRRTVTAALLSLVALAFLPGVAGAAQPATVRLVAIDPSFGSTTVDDAGRDPGHRSTEPLQAPRHAGGRCRGGAARILRRRAARRSRRDVNYAVSLRTAADDPRLSTARYAEAGWLIQQAESLIAAAPAAARGLEAGALQAAVWQLTDQAREVDPTSSATLNARTAALRALAAGRSVGGPVTITRAMEPRLRRTQLRRPVAHGHARQHGDARGRGRHRHRQPRRGPLRGRRHRAGRRQLVHPGHGLRHRPLRGRHAHPHRPHERHGRHPAGDDGPDAAVVLGDHVGGVRRLPGDPVRGPDHPASAPVAPLRDPGREAVHPGDPGTALSAHPDPEPAPASPSPRRAPRRSAPVSGRATRSPSSTARARRSATSPSRTTCPRACRWPASRQARACAAATSCGPSAP